MKKRILAGSVVMLVGCGLGSPPEGPLARPFQGPGLDGLNYSMLDLARSRPLVVVFYDPESKLPVLNAAAALEKRMAGRVEVLAVAAMPMKPFEQWRDDLRREVRGVVRPPVRVIPDPDRYTIQAYGARTSPTWQVIARGGILGPQLGGLSSGILDQVAAKAGALAGLPAPPTGVWPGYPEVREGKPLY